MSFLNQELASDTSDEDFTPANVVFSEADSDSEIETVLPFNEKEENVVTKESEEQRKSRLESIWNSMKQDVTAPQNRKQSILEIYNQQESVTSSTKTFQFAGENYTTPFNDLVNIKIKSKSLQLATQNNAAINPSDPKICTSNAPRRRLSRLNRLAIKYGVSETIRLNTLEKSKLDWNKFVEEEGIKDELKQKNKDGYLEKVAFLQRVDDRLDEQYQNIKKSAINSKSIL